MFGGAPKKNDSVETKNDRKLKVVQFTNTVSKGYKPDDHEIEPNILRYKITVLNQMKEELAKTRRPRFNTTKAERKAITTLKRNSKIVIKPADKGGAIVIQNVEDYIKEGERQLSNTTHYQKLHDSMNTIKQFIKDVKRSLDWAKAEELIDEELYKILYRETPRTSNLYLLPKIHKKDNPGRPIINSIGSLTETLSALVDEILRKYSKLVTSYVKDTTHFLNIIKELTITELCLLGTVDVTALYTNIPHEEGIQKIITFMKRHNAPDNEILLVQELLPHILKKNYFQFNNEEYLQTSGTAMGTRCAPNYAIIFMAELEEDFLHQQPKKPVIWKRFIDDIFLVWTHTNQELEVFMEKLNNFHPTIKFTKEVNEYGLAFLDTFVYKEGNQLKTKVYHKRTDNKQYLLYTSCHPKQQKDAIPFSLLIRARRICNKIEDFEKEARNIVNTLRRRKYPEKLLETAVIRSLNLNREDLLKPKEKKEDNRIRYIMTYNPRNPKMTAIMQQHIHLLAKMRRNPITHENIQTVFRKSKNLRDLIISGILNPKPRPALCCQPCKENRNKSCLTCERVSPCNTITSQDNVTLNIRGTFNCQSKDCIYALMCNCCKKMYVGESSQTINLKMRGHESHIKYWQKHPRNPVAQHFGTRQLQPKDYTLQILDQETDKNKRNRLEESWIFLLNTMTPGGLNSKW